MNIECYKITAARALEAFSFDEFSPSWATDGVNQWVDIEGNETNIVLELLEDFGLHPLIMANVEDPASGTRVLPFEKSLYMNVPLAQENWEKTGHHYLTFICLPNLLITLHNEGVDFFRELVEDLRNEEIHLVEASLVGLVHLILDQMIDRKMQYALQVRARVEAVAEILDEHPEDIDISEILILKRRTGHLAGACEGELYCLNALNAVQTNSFSVASMKDYFRDISGQLDYAFRIITRLESRLKDQHSFYAATLQERTNRRLNLLSIFAGIFMPLTLIAGIYGMNFDVMPELHYAWGYPAVLGLMLVVGLGMVAYFWKKGWFD